MKFVKVIMLGLVLAYCSACQPTEVPVKKSCNFSVPQAYTFKPSSYSGQTERLDMLDEMMNFLKRANVNPRPLDSDPLKGMFANDDGFGNPYPFVSGTVYTKNIRSKTAEAGLNVEFVEEILEKIESISNLTEPGDGWMTNSSNRKYLISSNGIEYQEVLEKVIMSTCFMHQALNLYLDNSPGGLMDQTVFIDQTVDPVNGTILQHHWDEAFGYFGANENFLLTPTDLRYWAKMSNARSQQLNLNSEIMNAFLKGRVAIGERDFECRDDQLDVIKFSWEIVSASTIIHYLNSARGDDFLDVAERIHALSQAAGLTYGLKFIQSRNIDSDGVDVILETMGGSSDFETLNFRNVSREDLKSAIDFVISFYPSLDNVKYIL